MPDKVIHEIRMSQYSAVPADLTRRFSLGTRDSYGVEQLRIVPGEGWDGLAITATFHAPEGEAVQVIVPADGLIDVPPEATRSGSELPIKYGKIVFAGVADGMQRISCNLPYTVLDHAPVEGAESSGPAPSWYEQAAAHFLPGGGKAGQVLAKASDADLDVEWADGGGSGTSDHAKLSNRDAADQHPISAITGLENALKGKQPAGDYLTADTLQAATDAALEQAKESGEFDGAPGADGKSAYQYAQDGGYTGTETEFAAKLAEEMPDKLPNPNTLTFTGAVSATYDGSEPVTVNIPEGGSDSYTLPIASAMQLGGVKPAAKTDEMTQAVGVDDTGGLWTMAGGAEKWELLFDLTTEEFVTSIQYAPDKKFTHFLIEVLGRMWNSETDGPYDTSSPIGLSNTLEFYVNNNRGIYLTAINFAGGEETKCATFPVYIFVDKYGDRYWGYASHANGNNRLPGSAVYHNCLRGELPREVNLLNLFVRDPHKKEVFSVGTRVRIWGR